MVIVLGIPIMLLILVGVILAIIFIVRNGTAGKCGGDCSECTLDCKKR